RYPHHRHLPSFPHDALPIFTVAIRVGFARDARLLGMRLVDFFAAKGAASHLLGARGTNLGKNLIVDRYCRRALAPAEAGNVTNRSEEHTSELQSRGHLVCRL